MADCAFYLEDSCGDKFCYTVADESYAPSFRKHAASVKSHYKTAEYRRKVPASRWPAFPLKVVVEPIHRD